MRVSKAKSPPGIRRKPLRSGSGWAASAILPSAVSPETATAFTGGRGASSGKVAQPLDSSTNSTATMANNPSPQRDIGGIGDIGRRFITGFLQGLAQVGGRDAQRLAVLGHGAARALDALLFQHL